MTMDVDLSFFHHVKRFMRKDKIVNLYLVAGFKIHGTIYGWFKNIMIAQNKREIYIWKLTGDHGQFFAFAV